MQYSLITILFHIYHIVLIFVGVFYVIYEKIVWISVLNTYLKRKRCIRGGQASIMINNPAESFFSSAEILLMFVLDAHSCFFDLWCRRSSPPCLINATAPSTAYPPNFISTENSQLSPPLDPGTFPFARTRGSRSLHLTLPKVQYATQLLPLPEASLIPYRRQDAECPETHTFIRWQLGH